MSKFFNLILVSLITFLGFAFANQEQQKTKAQQLIESSGKRSIEKEKVKENEKIIKEALNAFLEGKQIITLLNQGKVNESKERLNQIREKLEKLQKVYKDKMAKLPIVVSVYEVVGVRDIDTAKKIVENVKKAINENDLVNARILLNTLRNEIVIETQYLHLDAYKKAIDLALSFLEKGNITKAIESLNIGISSITVETTIIPKPIAEAMILVEDAEKLYKDDSDTALKLLEQAKGNINLAKALGYIKTEEEIKPLIAKIESLEKSIKANNIASKELFKDIKVILKETKEKSTTVK